MINLFLLLIFLACVGITAGWVAENPGDVTIHWFDYRIDTSFAFLMLAIICSAFILFITYMAIRYIIIAPGLWAERRSLKHHKKGLTELTYSVASLAATDIKKAETHTRRAESLLGRTPLTLLLSAQIARSQGDDKRTRLLLDQMLDYKETEYLAARSISDAANKQQIFPEALKMAERAHLINPKDIRTLLSLHIRLGRWNEALSAIKKSAKRDNISRAEIRHYRALVYVSQGIQMLETDQPYGALRAAKLCLKEAPNFLPAIVFAAKAYAATKQENKAIKLIMKTWAHKPHPHLGTLFLSINNQKPKDVQLKQVQKLASCNTKSLESDIVVAQAAINTQQWNEAHKTLQKAIIKEESVRICRMMALVEQGLSSDPDAGGKWFNRSHTALPDPEWVCTSCAHSTDAWHAHCPSCNEMDTQEWKRRQLAYEAA